MNQSIFNYLYGFAHQSPKVDAIIGFVANEYGLAILAILVVYLLEHEDKKKGVRDMVVVLTTAVIAWFIARFFKELFQTYRPFDMLPWVNPLLPESGFAFPSGHATFFMALASSLWFYHKRLAMFFGISAVAIGSARVMAGIHWPVDILGGLLLGYILGTGMYYFYTYLIKHWVVR